jgi:hypothetical protein
MGQNDVLRILDRLEVLEEKVNNQIAIQSGYHEVTEGYYIPNKITKGGTKKKYQERYLEEKITFKQPFRKKPSIMVGFSRIDTDSKTHNTRIFTRIDPEKVTPESFVLMIGTWNISKVYSFRVEWLAYTIVDEESKINANDE